MGKPIPTQRVTNFQRRMSEVRFLDGQGHSTFRYPRRNASIALLPCAVAEVEEYVIPPHIPLGRLPNTVLRLCYSVNDDARVFNFLGEEFFFQR